jgi:hypothetical protein
MSHSTQERPAPLPQGGDVDARGRLVPRSEADRQRRSAVLGAALDEIEAIGPDDSDAPEVWAEVFRGIDSARPQRPLFEGRY